MRKILFTILLPFICETAVSKPVSEQTASVAGTNFMTAKMNRASYKTGLKLTLAYTSNLESGTKSQTTTPEVAYYIFNVSNGFIIISGDDAAKPVLAYSNEGSYDPSNVSPSVAYWLKGYQSQIQYIINNNIQATTAISAQWNALIKNTPEAGQAATGVSPLLKTTWNQLPYYNYACPYDNTKKAYCVTGCVATAMAQVLKYWNYPTTGNGFYSYNDASYGTLSANFGNTTYDWSSMPNSITSANSAVATLMYHCGVSVNMNYGVDESTAYAISAGCPITNNAEYALKTYFGYVSTLKGLERSSYNNSTWISMLEKELDAGRPVIYTGQGTQGGHCFVFDGYDASNNFHVNWGWQGVDDGYFTIDALDPGTLGTGGGGGGYDSYQSAIFGIQPPNTNTSASSISLYDNVNISSSTLNYGSTFSVTTNLMNTGTNTFSGDYCAAIFDNTNTFFDYVQILSGETLASKYVYKNDLTFTYAGSYSLLPGKYTIGIFYRPTGGDWKLVANSGSYSNYLAFNVLNKGNLEMYSSMNITPGTTLTENQSVSVNFDIINTSSSTFNGNYDLSLYNLDGTHAFTIQTITSETLQYNYHYPKGLTFSNSDVNVSPGTYLLAMQNLPSGSSNYVLTGSTNYPNPIKVIVQAPGLQPDIYEPNNTFGTAYSLPLTFSGNTASVNTAGSNCHIGTDYDYYKVNLAPGFSYSISGRIDDAEGSGNSNTYTLDGVFSYSTDGGNTWSDPYEGTMPSSISLPNGGPVYFLISPAFSGQTGTYLLDMTITKAMSGIEQTVDNESEIIVYPNPAREILKVDLSGFKGNVNKVTLLNVEGQEVYSSHSVQNGAVNSISLSTLADGIYVLYLQTVDGIITRKVTVQR